MRNSIHTVAKYTLFQSQVNNNGAITFRNETYPQRITEKTEKTLKANMSRDLKMDKEIIKNDKFKRKICIFGTNGV